MPRPPRGGSSKRATSSLELLQKRVAVEMRQRLVHHLVLRIADGLPDDDRTRDVAVGLEVDAARRPLVVDVAASSHLPEAAPDVGGANGAPGWRGDLSKGISD